LSAVADRPWRAPRTDRPPPVVPYLMLSGEKHYCCRPVYRSTWLSCTPARRACLFRLLPHHLTGTSRAFPAGLGYHVMPSLERRRLAQDKTLLLANVTPIPGQAWKQQRRERGREIRVCSCSSPSSPKSSISLLPSDISTSLILHTL